MSDSQRPHGLYSPWNSLGQNTGAGSHSLLQGIFSTQGLNPVLPHCRWILYQLSHEGSPRILEWVAYLISSRSSIPTVMVGYRASRRGKEGLSRSFSECSRKPWVHSTCASDRRELLRVPLRSQGYCGVGRGLSGLHWVWRI